MKKFLHSILLLLCALGIYGQQNQQLFLMNYLGESNFLNPAIQSECKWFIGIPVLSSVHFNYANSAFTLNQLTAGNSDGTVNIDKVVNRLGRRSFIGTEFHTTIIALGYKASDYYFDFSIIEKVNAPVTFARDLFGLVWNGNHSYEESSADANGTAVYLNYYREFALGISKRTSTDYYFGFKGKLLFGKLNLATPSSNISLQTDPDSYVLTFDGDFLSNYSLPLVVDYDSGVINSITLQDPLNFQALLFNRKNWGFAVDAGTVIPINNKITISASILDLGFIRWRSNLNNIAGSGYFYYDGPLSDSIIIPGYTEDLINSFSDSMQLNATQNVYTTMLPVKAYFGLKYQVRPRLNAGAVFSTVLYRTKALTALTGLIEYNPFKNFYILGSYSLMYRSFSNVGLGFSAGRGPVQFYMISDNALGFILPYSSKNINLRFGLNINLGCSEKENKGNSGIRSGFSSSSKCPVYKDYNKSYKKKISRK
jgi:hypothetical protein